MKKICLLIALIMLLAVGPAFGAAGSVALSYATVSDSVSTVTWTWTGSTVDGSVPTAASTNVRGYVFLVTTNPGSPAPTDNYDIVLNDSEGVDIMGGELANRDTTTSEQAVPKIQVAYGPRFVTGPITIGITGNTATAATGNIKAYIAR